MAKQPKFRVYLAGPITGCNRAQVHDWRRDVKKKYPQCEYLDPVEHLLSERAIPHEVVAADIHAIQNADGILVNMWRESIGTAISVVHANIARRPVVVSDPNRLQNRALTFYADAVEDNPLKGMKALLALLNAESWHVMTRSGSGGAEEFRRSVLMTSIEDACRGAECDDIVIPRIVFPSVIQRLKKTHRKLGERITTTEIEAAVEEVLSRLSEATGDKVVASRILEEWQRTQQQVAARSPSTGGNLTPHARPVEVPVYSPKSHSTIWGSTVNKLSDVGSSEAREVLHSIAASVSGITSIVLTRMESGGKSRDRCQARIKASKQQYVIDGVLFDQGTRKGTKQHFQVRVQFDDEKAQIAHVIETRLRGLGLWARN